MSGELARSLVRSNYLTEAAAAGLLAQPLRLRNGSSLAPSVGINLSPGPAFVWWQLALGTTLTLVGALSLAASSRYVGNRWTRRATTLAFLVVTVVGLGTIIRSFRTA